MVGPRREERSATRLYAASAEELRRAETQRQDRGQQARCRFCEALLAADHTEDEVCSPCERRLARAEEEPTYNPRHDPEFTNRVAEQLFLAYPEAIILSDVLPATSWVIGDTVDELRERWGFVIAARKGIPGYRLVGWRRPERRRKAKKAAPTLREVSGEATTSKDDDGP